MNETYTGKPLNRRISVNIPSDELAAYALNRGIRETLGLPITKQLLYYSAPYSPYNPPVYVKEFEAEQYLTQEGLVTDWDICTLTLPSGKKVKIHSDFFANMQDPHFVETQQQLLEDKYAD